MISRLVRFFLHLDFTKAFKLGKSANEQGVFLLAGRRLAVYGVTSNSTIAAVLSSGGRRRRRPDLTPACQTIERTAAAAESWPVWSTTASWQKMTRPSSSRWCCSVEGVETALATTTAKRRRLGRLTAGLLAARLTRLWFGLCVVVLAGLVVDEGRSASAHFSLFGGE